jgi:hypothetical protein
MGSHASDLVSNMAQELSIRIGSLLEGSAHGWPAIVALVAIVAILAAARVVSSRHPKP